MQHSPLSATTSPIVRAAQRQYNAEDLILITLLQGYRGPVAVKSGTSMKHYGSPDPECTLHIEHPGVLRELILNRDIIKLAEMYIGGHIEVSGDMEKLFHLETHFRHFKPGIRTRLRLLHAALRLPTLPQRRHNGELKAGTRQQKNSSQAISHHYDVGNDFYRLWLDNHMVYSCAYFREPEQDIDSAQRDKLDYLCKKLRLKPGMSLLDIGCGWGALALWAAQHYGVTVHAITLSRQQFKDAERRVRQAGLEAAIDIELRDYRDLDEDRQYERIVSVGMFEHIGIDNFPVYFGKIKKLLKPGGLFLNHGITIKQNLKNSPLKRFVNQYIFPDGELTRISDVSDAMESAGFEILDIESLRRHYTLTLRRWVQALMRNFDQASTLTGVETARLWRLYMSGFAHYFDEGTVNVHQILVAHQHDRLAIPLRREDIYH